jgi:hypothetical protein
LQAFSSECTEMLRFESVFQVSSNFLQSIKRIQIQRVVLNHHAIVIGVLVVHTFGLPLQ